MDWFRWYNGTVADPKWRAIARRTGAPVAAVVAVWATICENANQSAARGTLANWCADDVAAALDLETEQVEAIAAAMQGKVLTDAALTGWEKRNPKREDPTATDRKRKQRERDRSVTPRDALAREDRDLDRELETTPSIRQAREAASLGDEDRISGVIRLANRGMNDNPAIDQYRLRPILPQHGDSRQVVADWRRAGVEWSTIEAVVYDRSAKYRPSDRYPQMNSLTYLKAAVQDAHEMQAAMKIQPPSIAETSDGDWLALVPAELREWAERVDAKLRADDIGRADAEKVRENLKRLNEAELRRLKPTEQEAYVWIRLLNWYGERVDDPRPNGKPLAVAS